VKVAEVKAVDMAVLVTAGALAAVTVVEVRVAVVRAEVVMVAEMKVEVVKVERVMVAVTAVEWREVDVKALDTAVGVKAVVVNTEVVTG
jgi:hypothetical protein